MRNGKYVDGVGGTYFYKNDKYHREDGPAVITRGGDIYWYMNGRIHREDGPAYITLSGYKEWYKNGEYHREDGPAIEYEDGSKWYVEGKRLSEQEFLLWKLENFLI